MKPRPGSRLAAFWLASLLGGCAAFSGYQHDPPDRPLPDSFRSTASPSPASVDLTSATNATRHEGFDEHRSVSLKEVVVVAREHANTVLEATALIDAASGRVQTAQGALLPGVSVEAGVGYLRGRDINNAGIVLDGVEIPRFEPSASIFYRVNLGAAITQSKRWQREADAAAYDARDAQRTAALQAAVGYLDLTLSYASFIIAEELVNDAERFLVITEARAEAEVGSGADVARAEAEVARARQTALLARGRWEQASVRLAVLLRWSPSVLLVPADRELEPTPLVDEAGVPALGAEAEEVRPDLRAAKARTEAASRLTAARWWELLGLELDASLRERLIGTQIDDLDNTTIADAFLRLSFDFGELGRLRTAKGETRAAVIREQALREQVEGEVVATAANVRLARETIPEALAGVEAAERSYRIELDRFQVGTGLGLEVIDAQNAQARARQKLAEAIVRYNVAQIELAATIGHLAPDLPFDSNFIP